MLVFLTKDYADQILYPSLCYSLMANASCDLFLMSTQVPMLRSKWQCSIQAPKLLMSTGVFEALFVYIF